MKKTYEVPQPLALALTTERVEFLKCLSDDDLKEKNEIQLVRDLLEDRIKLRRQVIKVTDALTQLQKQMNATLNKFNNLQDYLEGKAGEEENEE